MAIRNSAFLLHFTLAFAYRLKRHAYENTLKGSLSVLKLMPGTYFSQTGNPLQETLEIRTKENVAAKSSFSL